MKTINNVANVSKFFFKNAMILKKSTKMLSASNNKLQIVGKTHTLITVHEFVVLGKNVIVLNILDFYVISK